MKLRGAFSPPGDKSISHRLGIISLLASGRCRVSNFASGEDCASTLGVVEALGGQVSRQENEVQLTGLAGDLAPKAELDCGNSGTTMRLLMGLLAGVGGEYRLSGDQSLSARPMERVALPLRLMGAKVETTGGKPPVTVHGGGLDGIEYELPVASAQLKSAVLLAGLQARGVTTVIEPAASRDHTERMLAAWGAKLSGQNGVWRVEKSHVTLPPAFRVPGDASSAAFFLCGAAIMPGSEVTARGALLNPTRAGFLTVLERMGVPLSIEQEAIEPEPWGTVRAGYALKLRGCQIEANEIAALVDEVPILALVASQAQGTTVFKEVGELRLKETDRLAAVASQLGAMGADISERGDDLVIQGPTPLSAPARLDSFGDHRISMTLRLAGLLAGARSEIEGEQCTAISYPGFAQTLEGLLA
jgi:3-phosphoshikimate 1-carboxyvinyltransferase